MENIKNFLGKLPNNKLLMVYSLLIKEYTDRGLIRTKNVVGDLAEYIVVDYFKSLRKLPSLKLQPPSNKSFDALDKKGKKYSIKSTSGSTTEAFWGIPLEANTDPVKVFDYVIVVRFDRMYTAVQIFQLTWEQFWERKRPHSTMKTWVLPINKDVIKNSKVIYEAK